LFQRDFVLKNPVSETLVGHGLREIGGVFGFFSTAGKIFKMITWITWITWIAWIAWITWLTSITTKKYFQPNLTHKPLPLNHKRPDFRQI
jgi:hypothetical protein